MENNPQELVIKQKKRTLSLNILSLGKSKGLLKMEHSSGMVTMFLNEDNLSDIVFHIVKNSKLIEEQLEEYFELEED